ncbi:LOW QUALITY PROTEIN: charged multivesicular body protein 6-A-like [Pollicipes pollicipes]|uniref:LOW QUALITY PROTEIN: charged multivesicular body protein 6-A-like n=1 Tax=Pollicipes pollicipes TaxID=41117 RepID=UPI001884DFBC|nr:LOW QUALITY PROTEIN: charged multivesicular body protein 6-A-like [Pollicipes pollicipes]
MGSLFSRKKESRITEQDKAVLQLKKQRDQLKQYTKKIQLTLEKDRQMAKTLLHSGQKSRAKLLLKKKRFQEQLLTRTEGMLDNIEQMTHDLEFAQVEMKVLDGLKDGNAALKKMHDLVSIDEIERIMDETQDGIEKQQEIDELLSGQLTDEDEQAVLAELDELVAAELPAEPAQRLPDVPAEPLPQPEPEPERDEPEPERAAPRRVPLAA